MTTDPNTQPDPETTPDEPSETPIPGSEEPGFLTPGPDPAVPFDPDSAPPR